MFALSIATALLSAATGASYIYIDLSLNRMGASATDVGLNASMPALGWLLATPFLPFILRRLNPKIVLLTLLGVAIIALFGFPLFPNQRAWLPLRFLLGGSVGMAFRLIEYWISAASPSQRRGRNVGVYTAAFCAGAALGAGMAPVVGLQGWPPILLILILLSGAALTLGALTSAPPAILTPPTRTRHGLFGPAFIAVTTACFVGLFEAVPYTLMPIYALRVGLSECWAAWTGSAFLVGQIIIPVLLGSLADRAGKQAVLALSTIVALAMPVILPTATGHPEALLTIMLVWGGFVGSLYAIALSMLADHASGADLATANARFGTFYAAGSLVGPLLHGAAMDWRNPQGLMESSLLLFFILFCIIAGHAPRESLPIWRRIFRSR